MPSPFSVRRAAGSGLPQEQRVRRVRDHVADQQPGPIVVMSTAGVSSTFGYRPMDVAFTRISVPSGTRYVVHPRHVLRLGRRLLAQQLASSRLVRASG